MNSINYSITDSITNTVTLPALAPAAHTTRSTPATTAAALGEIRAILRHCCETHASERQAPSYAGAAGNACSEARTRGLGCRRAPPPLRDRATSPAPPPRSARELTARTDAPPAPLRLRRSAQRHRWTQTPDPEAARSHRRVMPRACTEGEVGCQANPDARASAARSCERHACGAAAARTLCADPQEHRSSAPPGLRLPAGPSRQPGSAR